MRLTGLASPALLSPVPDSWPLVTVRRRPINGDTPQATRTEHGELAFESGWSLRFEREPRIVTLFLPESVSDDEVVHPRLAPLAQFFAGWLGYDSLHGGAFLRDGAWGVLAKRMGGKSTTLAALTERGVPVLTDDVLVLDGGEALAGPRCIDLRPSAELGDRPTIDVRGGTRRRLALAPIAPAAPLRGIFLLEWGERLELRRLSPQERLMQVARHCQTTAAAGRALLDLARLPAWLVGRPSDLRGLDDVCDLLLETAGM